MPSKRLIQAGVCVSILWLFITGTLAQRFNIPSADGILYSLPFATARHPFDFGIPFLNDFEGYGSAWGHHWPGGMWLRGLIFSIVPFSRGADVVILSLFQLLTACAAAWFVWKNTRGWWPAICTWILILSDRLLLLASAGNRFEAIAVCVVVLWFVISASKEEGHPAVRAWAVRLLAFLCPTLHPYALVMGVMILAHEFLASRSRNVQLRWGFKVEVFSFLLGCLASAVWFIAQPDALQQFTTNFTLQKSFYQSWNTVISGLGNYRMGGGVLLWGTGLASVVFLNLKSQLPITGCRLGLILFTTVIAIHTLTRCENFHYLALGSPFAVMMLAIGAERWTHASPLIFRMLPIAGLAGITFIHAILTPYRVHQFRSAGMPNVSEELRSVLTGIPENRTVFIPHLLWPAAMSDLKHDIRWFTLPFASSHLKRQAYEQQAYSNARPGDFLIIENGGARQIDRFGVYPTFAMNPPDPSRWRKFADKTLTFSGASSWGFDLSIYEFHQTMKSEL